MEVRTRVGSRDLTISNLDKVLFPAVGFTKAEVINYYLQIAETLLPHVRDRAVTRIRFPDGVAAGTPQFYEKNAPAGCPAWVPTQVVRGSEGDVRYVVLDEPETLIYLANLASLELHAPQWRISSAPHLDGAVILPQDTPRATDPLADRIVIDCDPGEGVTMIESAKAALIIGAALASDDLLAVPRTSGSKGLQICAAIQPVPTETARAYVHDLSVRLARQHPDLFVVTVDKQSRAGKIFLDYNQNLASRNTVASYSLRAREEPRVATPLAWDEVIAVDRPDALRFGPDDVIQRVADYGDLAADLLIADPPALPTPTPRAGDSD